MELRLKREYPNVAEGVLFRADVCRELPRSSERATRPPCPPHQACVLIRCGTPDVIQIRPYGKTDFEKLNLQNLFTYVTYLLLFV